MMQKLSSDEENCHFRPGINWSLKPNIDSFIEVSSDHSLLFYVKFSLNFEGSFVQMGLESRRFGEKNPEFGPKFVHLCTFKK